MQGQLAESSRYSHPSGDALGKVVVDVKLIVVDRGLGTISLKRKSLIAKELPNRFGYFGFIALFAVESERGRPSSLS